MGGSSSSPQSVRSSAQRPASTTGASRRATASGRPGRAQAHSAFGSSPRTHAASSEWCGQPMGPCGGSIAPWRAWRLRACIKTVCAPQSEPPMYHQRPGPAVLIAVLMLVPPLSKTGLGKPVRMWHKKSGHASACPWSALRSGLPGRSAFLWPVPPMCAESEAPIALMEEWCDR